MVASAVRTGTAVGVLLVVVIAWITWLDSRDDEELMAGTWVAVLMIGLPIGLVLGAALGLVGGLLRRAGTPRWLAAGAAGAVFVVLILIFGQQVRVAAFSVIPVVALSWLALLWVDRWRPRTGRGGAPGA